MARRLPNVVVLVALVLAPWSASEAFAQVRSELPLVDFGAAVGQAFGQPVRLSDFEQRPVQLPRPAPGTQSSTALKSLYATTIVMQGLDVHSTLAIVSRGGAEANPLMAGPPTVVPGMGGATMSATPVRHSRWLREKLPVIVGMVLLAVGATQLAPIVDSFIQTVNPPGL